MNIYRTEFFAFCPVNGVRVKYHLSIETTETIRVEQIIEEVTMHQKGFHEEIADDLLRSFGGRQTLIAEHHGVQIETQRAVAAAGRFVRLADSDWVNIVNHPDVLDRPDRDTELAVSCAVRLTEGRLQELNTPGVPPSDGGQHG